MNDDARFRYFMTRNFRECSPTAIGVGFDEPAVDWALRGDLSLATSALAEISD